MLNNTSSSTFTSYKISDVFGYAHAKEVKESSTGKIFKFENFAKNWDSIYVYPDDLEEGEVTKGMRRIEEPTLLTTTMGNSMALIVATQSSPVFIPGCFSRGKEGYLLAYRKTPIIKAEYIYYLCKYGKWSSVVCIDEDLYDLIGSVDDGIDEHGHCYSHVFTPEEAYYNSDGTIKIPSLEHQENLIAAAKKEDEIIKRHQYNVADLVNRYMTSTRQFGIFNQNGLGLLAEAYRIAAGEYAKPEILNILNEYEFKEDILSQQELRFLSKHLNELFDLVVSSNGVKFHSSDGFIQPQEVTDFMCKMASFPEDVTVYNPFSGANSYAIALPNHVVGEELNRTTWALGQIRLFANNADKRADISLGDSFESMTSNKKFSAIISSPAYLVENGHEIADIVGMLYNKLEDGGRLACIVSAGFLFRKDRKVRTVREKLIHDKAIASVVMLPSNIFTGSSVAQAAILLTKGIENEDILFGNAGGYTRFAKSVFRATTFDLENFLEAFESDLEDTQKRYGPCEGQTGIAISYEKLIGSDLTPSLYLTPKPTDGVPLSELVEEVPELRGKDISAEYYITGSSIPAAMHRKPFVPAKVEAEKVATAKKHVQVPENAVILAIVSGNIRTVYTEGFTGKIAFPTEFIKVLNPKNGVSAKYLAAVLSTKIVADQIKAQTVGVTIPSLNKLNLGQIILPRHSTVEEREQLISKVLSSEMSNLESELQETLDSQKREVRSTRHAMIQTLSALSSNWEQLKMYAELHEEGIKLSDTVGRINPISVKDLMGSIGYAMSTLQRQVESLRFEKPDWGKDAEINPYKFINDYIAAHSTPAVRMVNIGNDNVADFPYFDDETGESKYHHTDAADIFYAPVRLLERIFDNIVANAKAHGFTAASTNNEIRFDWKSEDGGIVITIANNGRPLKDGVTGEDVLMSGFTTALNENASDGTLHSGQGGFEIKSLMEGLGTVEVISQPDAEFPVIYKLTFEKTNFETINLFED